MLDSLEGYSPSLGPNINTLVFYDLDLAALPVSWDCVARTELTQPAARTNLAFIHLLGLPAMLPFTCAGLYVFRCRLLFVWHSILHPVLLLHTHTAHGACRHLWSRIDPTMPSPNCGSSTAPKT